MSAEQVKPLEPGTLEGILFVNREEHSLRLDVDREEPKIFFSKNGHYEGRISPILYLILRERRALQTSSSCGHEVSMRIESR